MKYLIATLLIALGVLAIWGINRQLSTLKIKSCERVECDSFSDAISRATTAAVNEPLVLLMTTGTPSMEPTIRGKVVLLVDVMSGIGGVRIGDIITYYPEFNPSVRYAHRVVGIDAHGLILAGDNNAESEVHHRVTEKNFHGKVTHVFQPNPPVYP